MSINTSISDGEHVTSVITTQVQADRDGSANEAVRAGEILYVTPWMRSPSSSAL
jgi:hypothetical protein